MEFIQVAKSGKNMKARKLPIIYNEKTPQSLQVADVKATLVCHRFKVQKHIAPPMG